MNLVGYEFSSDEEEANEKNTTFYELKEKNENQHNNGKQNKNKPNEIEIDAKRNLKTNELDDEKQKTEDYYRNRLKEDDEKEKRNGTLHIEKRCLKNDDYYTKSENQLNKLPRTSRWDSAYSSKKKESKKQGSNDSDMIDEIVSKVKELLEEDKGNTDKKRTNAKREEKNEKNESEDKQEKEDTQKDKSKQKYETEKTQKTNACSFFENCNLMNVDINEENFEEIFEHAPNEYSECINKKIEELKKLYELGLTINKNIYESREYKNPCILEKIMRIFEIEQYASNYPTGIFNPEELKEIDLFNEKEKRVDLITSRNSKWSFQN